MAYTGLFQCAAQASAYASARPRYPPELYTAIFEYLGVKSGQRLPLAVDIATGSGQVLHGLQDKFEKLIGLDASAKQVEAAPAMERVTFMVGDAHSLPLESGTADLVTVGQALHWLDRPAFYKEAARVLRPDTGVLAAFCYGFGDLHPIGGAADKLYHHMGNGILGPYWAGPRELVDNNYTTVEPMSPYFQDTARHDLTMSGTTSVDDLHAYIGSWSAYVTYRSKHPELPDPLQGFREQLEAAVKQDGGDPSRIPMTRPVALLLARGPCKEAGSTGQAGP